MAILGIDAVPEVSDRALLNRMNSHAQAVQLGDKVFSAKQAIVAKYDFSVQGSNTAGIYLDDAKGEDLRIPANFVITNFVVDRATAINTSASSAGTFSIGINSTADLLSSTAKTAFDGTGFLAGVPVGTAATNVLVAAESRVLLTHSAAITAGKFYAVIEGYQGRSF